MAPIEPSATAQAENAIRDTIQSLFNVMLHTSAYDAAGPQTSVEALIHEVQTLSRSLREVSSIATAGTRAAGNGYAPHGHNQAAATAAGPRLLPSVPRDLVQYVEDGRNPDIYTREFVELVRRTNQLRAGKSAAFAQFRDALAGQIRSALPELAPDVDRVVAATTEAGGGGAAAPSTAAAATAPSAATSAPAAVVPASLSRSASASASPQISSGGPGPGPGGIDMLGMLPSTPTAQPLLGAAPTAADAGARNGASDDAMQTS